VELKRNFDVWQFTDAVEKFLKKMILPYKNERIKL